MTASPDWVKICRSIDKYGDDPIRLKAWLYLILDAKWNGTEIGTITTTWTKLAIRWGLYTKTSRGEVPNINQAKRLVKEMEEDGRVERCKQVVSNVSAKCKQEVSLLLINYANIQGKSEEAVSNVSASCKQSVSSDENEPLPVTVLEPLRIKKKELRTNTEKNKRGSTEGEGEPASASPSPIVKTVTKKKVLLDRAKIKEILDEIELNLDPFKEIYGNYPVLDTWGWFYEACLDGTAKKPGVNPYKYVNFRAAFSNWLKKAYPLASISDEEED